MRLLHAQSSTQLDSITYQRCISFLLDLPSRSESMTRASQPVVLSALREVEEELTRHRAYLDQLLSVVIEHSPDLLKKMMEQAEGAT